VAPRLHKSSAKIKILDVAPLVIPAKATRRRRWTTCARPAMSPKAPYFTPSKARMTWRWRRRSIGPRSQASFLRPRAVSDACRAVGARPRRSRVQKAAAQRRRCRVHVPCRHDGAGDVRVEPGNSSRLRSQHQLACGEDRDGYRRGDAFARIGRQKKPSSAHASGPPAAFILAKATDDEQIAAASKHLRRYIEYLFNPANQKGKQS
jgi:hypothetical protein